MTDAETAPPYPEDARREMFAALVTAQDGGLAVRPSREQVAREYEVSLAEVVAVEREGMDKAWPPL